MSFRIRMQRLAALAGARTHRLHTSRPALAVDPSAKKAADETGRIMTGGGEGTKGVTGGGGALGSTAPGAPGKPKVVNFSTPGRPGEDKRLSEEQKREVEEHNREFERTHGGAGKKDVDDEK